MTPRTGDPLGSPHPYRARVGPVALRLRAIAGSATAARIASLVAETSRPDALKNAAIGIALTEMTARPADARFMEWLVVLPLRSGLLGDRGRVWAAGRSVGPFQLRNAPFNLRDAVGQVCASLESREADPVDLARLAEYWNGSGTQLRRSPPYSAVLALAVDLVERSQMLKDQQQIRANCDWSSAD